MNNKISLSHIQYDILIYKMTQQPPVASACISVPTLVAAAAELAVVSSFTFLGSTTGGSGAGFSLVSTTGGSGAGLLFVSFGF